MKKYLYPLVISKIRPYLKHWFLFGKKFAELVSLISQTLPLTLNNTLELKFDKFQPEGATVQDGIPTPENLVEIKNVEGEIEFKVENKNFYSNNINDYTNIGVYKTKKLNLENKLLKISFFDKDTSIDLTGISLGFGLTTTPAQSGYVWNLSNGVVTAYNTNITVNGIAGEKADYIIIYPNNSSTFEKINQRYNIQIEIENESEYIQHAEQIALFTFEEGQYLAEGGYLADDGIHNIWEKVILDGSDDEEFLLAPVLNTADYNCFSYRNLKVKQAPDDTSINVYCDKLIRDSSNHRTQNKLNCWISHLTADNVYFHLPNTITTIQELRTYLATNNLTFLFVVKSNYEITSYTKTQATQWNAIKNLYGYNEQTNISCTGSEVMPKLSIDYYVKGGE